MSLVPTPTPTNKSKLDEYIACITSKLEPLILHNNNKKAIKAEDADLKIPNMHNYMDISNYNYSVQQLKYFAKHYKLKVGGNKKELIGRIFGFLHLSIFAIRLQKTARGKLQRIYNQLHGPAYAKRSLCTNDSDFVTLDSCDEISCHQFISYKDADNFVYGFDMASLYSLLSKNHFNEDTVKNPYNRTTMSSKVFENMFDLIRLSKIMKIKLNVQLENDMQSVSLVKAVELRALELFQNIDSLGNYSDPSWFLSLNRHQLVRFTRELSEIFNYRAQLTTEVKRNICPPAGDPFMGITQYYMQTEVDLINVQRTILGAMEKLVNTGIDTDSKSLGAYYVLGALTLVSESASASLPWLYQSVAYF